jgi:hydroxypyruvate reductase
VGDVVFQRTVNAIIGSNETALEGIRTEAAHEGIRRVRLLPGFLTGEARECAVRFAREMKAFASTTPEGTPALLIAGGETTVTVSGKGIGGRNQELALACASEIDGESGLFVLAAGSDGVDGVSDAAGAYADHTTRARGMALDLRLWSYLERNDSHSYFSALGDLIHTGPTGTNVADVALGLVLR